MTVVDWIAFVWSVPVVGALACRCDVLRFGTHNPLAVLMHWAMFVATLVVPFNAGGGHTGLQDFGTLLSCSAWIVLSLPTWAGGAVPGHLRTRPAELDDAEMGQIVGGQGE